MGFNRRRIESERKARAAQEAEARRQLGQQIIEDAKRLVTDWNERQARHGAWTGGLAFDDAVSFILDTCGARVLNLLVARLKGS